MNPLTDRLPGPQLSCSPTYAARSAQHELASYCDDSKKHRQQFNLCVCCMHITVDCFCDPYATYVTYAALLLLQLRSQAPSMLNIGQAGHCCCHHLDVSEVIPLIRATSSRTHLLQIKDHANIVLLELRHNIILQDVLLPRPCHSQHLVAHPATVKPRYSIWALLATWVFMRAVPATLTKALNFLFDEKAPGP